MVALGIYHTQTAYKILLMLRFYQFKGSVETLLPFMSITPLHNMFLQMFPLYIWRTTVDNLIIFASALQAREYSG